MTESFISSMKGINPHTDDNNIVTFEVLTVVTMKFAVSWDRTSCSLDVQYQVFGENCCLSLQGQIKVKMCYRLNENIHKCYKNTWHNSSECNL
jgi:hypothetical protein